MEEFIVGDAAVPKYPVLEVFSLDCSGRVVKFDYVFFKVRLGDVIVVGEGVELGPAVGVEGVIAQHLVEEGAAFQVRVGDLYFWGEEGGVVAIELGGLKYGVSKLGGTKL